jgi:hypothetical protein
LTEFSLPILGQRQFGLWEPTCSTECVLWTECGGSDSAPCGCIRTKNRFHCHRCPYICRERGLKASDPEERFEAYLQPGLTLELLQLTQPVGFTLPPFVPTKTDQLRQQLPLDLNWAAVDAKALFTRHRHEPVQLRPFVSSPTATRRALNLSASTELLTVLNGRDGLLEGFWMMQLEPFFERLRAAGIRAVTGPTFSITSEQRTPASHNVLMLLRHHYIVEAIHQAGFIAIPNLYWRTAWDRARWIEWLQQNPGVIVISRDFTRTKGRQPFRPEFEGLLEIVRGAGRRLHVVVLGVGIKKAPGVFRQIADLGSSVTIVSAEPVMQAIKRGLGWHREQGSLPQLITSQRLTRFELAEANLRVMSDYIDELADEEGR